VSGINSILADTNILVYLLDGRPQLIPYFDSLFYISSITELEFIGVKEIPKLKLKKRESLVNDCIILPFDDEIIQIAISIKQQVKVKAPDAIIAATSIKHQLPLLTADIGFKRIPNLSLIILEL
jgi:predicted nucleic acid-binding protein